MSLMRQKIDNAVRAAEGLSVAVQQLAILGANAERRAVREGYHSIYRRADELITTIYGLSNTLRDVRSEASHEGFGKPSGKDDHD